MVGMSYTQAREMKRINKGGGGMDAKDKDEDEGEKKGRWTSMDPFIYSPSNAHTDQTHEKKNVSSQRIFFE
jgi:hypothetical protein